MSVADFIANVPKTELHIHIEATSYGDTYLELNERHGIDSSLNSIESINKLIDISSLDDMIQNFILLQSFVRTEEDYSLLARDIGKYSMDNNIRYCEAHFSISLPKQRGLDVIKIVGLLEDELENVYHNDDIDIRLIIDLSRTFGVDNAADNLSTTIDLISRSKHGRIAAIGLGGSEKEGDIVEYKPIFEKAQAHGLRCVAHAGEVSSSKNIHDAIHLLGAQRIGHGISAMFDDGLRKQLSKTQVPIEISMTSNVITKKYVSEYDQHPVKQFFNDGINICISSDDPFLFGTGLVNEYQILHQKLGFTIPEIVTLLSQSIAASFMPSERKAKLRSELFSFYANWYHVTHL